MARPRLAGSSPCRRSPPCQAGPLAAQRISRGRAGWRFGQRRERAVPDGICPCFVPISSETYDREDSAVKGGRSPAAG